MCWVGLVSTMSMKGQLCLRGHVLGRFDLERVCGEAAGIFSTWLRQQRRGYTGGWNLHKKNNTLL